MLKWQLLISCEDFLTIHVARDYFSNILFRFVSVQTLMFTHVMFKLSSNTISKAVFFFYKVTTLVYSLYATLWLYFDSDSLPLQKPWTFHRFIVIKCWFQDIVGCLQNLISPVEYIGIGIFLFIAYSVDVSCVQSTSSLKNTLKPSSGFLFFCS